MLLRIRKNVLYSDGSSNSSVKKKDKIFRKKKLKMKWGFPNLIIEFSVDIFRRPAIDS